MGDIVKTGRGTERDMEFEVVCGDCNMILKVDVVCNMRGKGHIAVWQHDCPGVLDMDAPHSSRVRGDRKVAAAVLCPA